MSSKTQIKPGCLTMIPLPESNFVLHGTKAAQTSDLNAPFACCNEGGLLLKMSPFLICQIVQHIIIMISMKKGT